jgi:hypothetical protein
MKTLLLSAFAGVAFSLAVSPELAQNTDFNLSLHAHDHASASQIGLPQYPGSVLAPDKDDDSGSADLGLVLGSFHFKMLVAQYKTTDSPAKLFAFYRKALSRYGQVLECDHGKPVGSLTQTSAGLTCSSNGDQDDKSGGKSGDGSGGGMNINGHNSSEDHELRAGDPQHIHLVGIDNTAGGITRFALMYLELPRDQPAN